MKIFFSLNNFLPTHLAGIEVYTFNLARSLQSAGQDVAVLIPFFDSERNDCYSFHGIKVIRYAENSFEDRNMILGKKKPSGLGTFTNILKSEKPAIVHFQELAPGRGVSMFHLEAAAGLGIKTYLTCHLSTYSCQTGNLIFKDETPCDGIIRTGMCTACAYHARGIQGSKALILEHAATLLHSTGFNASHLNSSLGTALSFPYIVNRKKEELLKAAYLCEKIVVLTKWYKRILELNGVAEGKLVYCAQGLTGTALKPILKKTGTPLKIVFVGRVSKYKGIHLLLEALKELPRDKFTLDVYGPITEDAYARECQVQSEGMANVRWKGTVASEEVIAMLNEHDLLCLPSTFSEMSPLVIQEAFAAGIPVLASNVYGNAEQVEDGVNGWLFEFKNAASLKHTLGELLEQPGLIDEAKKKIPVSRGFDVVAREHMEIYEDWTS